jgi:hypothetical protein
MKDTTVASIIAKYRLIEPGSRLVFTAVVNDQEQSGRQYNLLAKAVGENNMTVSNTPKYLPLARSALSGDRGCL